MRRRFWLLLALLAVPACGVPEEGPPVYPVTGEVFFRGKPAAGAMVVLHPVGRSGRAYSGEVGPDGAFQITARTNGDGAPAGKYAVALTWTQTVKANDVERETPDRFGRRYEGPERPYTTIEVKPGTNRVPRIDIE